MTKRLNVLIVEDDENDSNALAAEIAKNADRLCLAGVSKSSYDALAFIRNHKPHAVILDLGLQEGRGDGMDLLDKMHSAYLNPKPYVVVNTNSTSKITRDTAKSLGADYSFAKWQKGYSPKMVIDHLLLVLPAVLGCGDEPPAPLTEEQSENKMRGYVHKRFNALGISVKHAGYNYLAEAVILTAKGENGNWCKIIGDKIGKSEDAVAHAMQYAINITWLYGDINVLQAEFTAPTRKETPTVNEFVPYFKQQLLDYLNR